MEDFGYKIKIMDELIKTQLNKQLQVVDLTSSQMQVLIFLEQNRGIKVTQKYISEGMGIKHSTAIGILSRMEEKGLIQIKIDSENKKYRNIILTKKADKIREVMFAHKIKMEEKITKDFSISEKENFESLLNKAIENLHK